LSPPCLPAIPCDRTRLDVQAITELGARSEPQIGRREGRIDYPVPLCRPRGSFVNGSEQPAATTLKEVVARRSRGPDRSRAWVCRQVRYWRLDATRQLPRRTAIVGRREDTVMLSFASFRALDSTTEHSVILIQEQHRPRHESRHDRVPGIERRGIDDRSRGWGARTS